MTMKSGIRDTIKDNQANRASRNEELRSVIHGRFAEKRSLRAGGEANHSAGRKEWVKGGVASLMLLGGAGIFHGVAYASGNAEVTVEQETTSLSHHDVQFELLILHIPNPPDKLPASSVLSGLLKKRHFVSTNPFIETKCLRLLFISEKYRKNVEEMRFYGRFFTAFPLENPLDVRSVNP